MNLENIDEEKEDIENEFEMIRIEENEENLTSEIAALNNTPFTTRIMQDVYQNLYQVSKTQLVESGLLIGIPKEYIEEKFDTFLFEDPMNLQFIDYARDPQYTFWAKAFCFDESWESFSELALRYSCAFTSEAIVERYLSIQKCIQGDRLTPVIKARLRLHQT